MGKCLSCCQPARQNSQQPYVSSSQSPHRGKDNNRSSTGIKAGLGSNDGRGVRGVNVSGGTSSQHSSLISGKTPSTTSTEKKMFTQYPKLPPIRKPSNGEHHGKRVSLISKEFSESKIQTLFERYKDPDEDAIFAEGIEKFCLDLDVNPDEFVVLLIAWHFHAETMCRFSKEEFCHGCKTLKVDSIKGIQTHFPELKQEVENKQTFKELYRWTYKFALDTDSGQRTLPIDMAISLWKLVFSQRIPAILDHWLEFLEKHHNLRGIPKDTWDMFLNFTEQVGNDLTTYDDTDAWPSLIDDFVEYENDRQNQNVKAD